MNEHITASPLTWPQGWKRSKQLISSRFGKWNNPVSINKAVRFVIDNLRQMGVSESEVIISTDLKLRNDGLPYSNQKNPSDTGAAVWWKKDGEQKVIALDKYDRIADNIYAIGKTVDALRGIERWGGGEILNRTFTGFTALPDPNSASQPHWRTILDYQGSVLTEANKQYKKLRSRYHPDTGGSAEEFHILNLAWKQAEQELSN